jgi:hypothetical protein
MTLALIVSVYTVALSTPPSPPPIGSSYPLGFNGTNYFPFSLDANGNLNVAGTGTAGSPSGGILSIQGVSSAVAVKTDSSAVTQPVSGTVAATQSGLFNVNQAIGVAGFSKITDGTHTVTVTAGNALQTDSSGTTQPVSGTVTATQPFTGGANGVATAAGQSVGLQAYNATTSAMDAVQVNSAEQVLSAAYLQTGPNSGADVVGTVILQATTPIIVSGTATAGIGKFGTALCTPSPACGALIKTGGGVVKGIRWNSVTGLGSIVLSCWNGTAAGNYDNLLFIATGISAGGVVPIPSGGDAFSVGLFCQVSAFISTTQNFAFEVQ